MAKKQPDHNQPKKTKGFLGLFRKDVDGVVKSGHSRLQVAVHTNNIKKVRELLNLGANPDFTGLRGPEERPLATALENYYIDIAETLLRGGADANHHILGKTYLSRAAELRSPTLLDHLLSHKGDPKIRDLWTEETPLFHVHDHDPHFIDALVRYGCDINAQNHEGYSALYKAVTFRKYRLADALLKRRANPNIKPDNAPDLIQIVLENASDKNDRLWGLVKPLIDAGANADVRTTDGQSLYMKAIMFQDTNMMRFAQKHCTDIKQLDSTGSTPLHAALLTKNTTVISSVLDQYTKCPAGKNAKGHSVVTMMLQDPFYLDQPDQTVKNIINRIFDLGGNPDAQDHNGRTMLHQAVAYQNTDLVEIMLKHAPSLDLRDTEGHTPLSLAVSMNNLDMVDMLLDQGANPNITNEKGWTILDLMSLHKGDRTSPMVQRLIAAGGRYVKQLPANDHAPSNMKAPEIRKKPEEKGKSIKPPKPF